MNDEDFRSVPAQLSAKLADAEARIAQLEAALAAAHEALRKIETGARRANERGGSGPCATFVAELPLDTKKALSGRALKRAAEELRLLRELEAADAATDAAAAEHVSGRGTAEAMYSAANDRDAALANLRRFREEHGEGRSDR